MENSLGGRAATLLFFSLMITRFCYFSINNLSLFAIIGCAIIALAAAMLVIAIEGRAVKTTCIIALFLVLFAARNAAGTLFYALGENLAVSGVLIALFIAAAVTICTRGKVRALGNITLVSLPFIIAALVLLICFSLQNIRLEYFEAEAFKIHEAAFWEIILLPILMPGGSKRKKRKAATYAVSFACVFAVGFKLLYSLCVPLSFHSYFKMPIFELSRMGVFRTLFYHSEGAMVLLWTLLSLIYLSWCTVTFGVLLKKLTNIEHTKPLSYITVFLLVLTVSLPVNNFIAPCEPEERFVALVMGITQKEKGEITLELLASVDGKSVSVAQSGKDIASAMDAMTGTGAYRVDLSHLRTAVISNASDEETIRRMAHELARDKRIAPHISLCVTEKSIKECFKELSGKGNMGVEKYLDTLSKNASTLCDVLFCANDAVLYSL